MLSRLRKSRESAAGDDAASAQMKANLQRALGAPHDDEEVRADIAQLRRQRNTGMLSDLEYATKVAARIGTTRARR